MMFGKAKTAELALTVPHSLVYSHDLLPDPNYELIPTQMLRSKGTHSW